jgi:hypothetical protein
MRHFLLQLKTGSTGFMYLGQIIWLNKIIKNTAVQLFLHINGIKGTYQSAYDLEHLKSSCLMYYLINRHKP